MYKKTEYGTSNLDINESTVGETIEMKVERIVNNGEGVEDGAPSIYTERAMGIMPEYDIRTDKWDLALDAMDKVHKQDVRKRMTSIEERQKAFEEMRKKDNNSNVENVEIKGDNGGATA
nr:MAG: hypothetical protein [Microvirus sp.]